MPAGPTDLTQVGFQRIADLSSVQGLNPPSDNGPVFTWIWAESQNVRFTLDGNNPTATSGALIIAGAHEPLVLHGRQQLDVIKFLEAAGGAALSVFYWGFRAPT